MNVPCKCARIYNGQVEHDLSCRNWKPLWKRVRDEKLAKQGRTAEHALDRS